MKRPAQKNEHDTLIFGAHLAEYLDIQPHEGVVEYVRAVEAKEIKPPRGKRAASPNQEGLIMTCLKVGLICGLRSTHNDATADKVGIPLEWSRGDHKGNGASSLRL